MGELSTLAFFPILNLHIKKCGEDEEIFATIKNWQRLKGGIFICLEAMGNVNGTNNVNKLTI
jgi:hypothetical protein